MYLGKVISSECGPTPTEADFVVANVDVHKNQFVQMEVNGKQAVGNVSELIKVNRYYQRADSVQHCERNGTELSDRFPTKEWEYVIAKSNILGVYDDKLLKRPTLPASPGTKVFKAEDELLRRFLGFKDNGLTIGNVEHHDVPVSLDLTKTFQKHLAILAMSGAGKSYATGVLLEELLDRPKEAGRPAIVVIDVHGEYKSFADDANYRQRTKVFSDMKIAVPDMTLEDYASFMSDTSAPQKRELGRVVAKMKHDNAPFDLQDIISEVKKDASINELISQALTAWLHQLDNSGLFAKTGSFSIKDLAKQGQLSVVDLSDLVDQKRKQLIVSFIAKQLFNMRRSNAIPPFILFVEEAHNFAQEGDVGYSISRPIIETIAREGRKFGASLCLISQRPKKLSTTALSQCNTQMILRVTNPYDIKHISESSEGIDQAAEKSIPGLRVGEALLFGEAVNYPVFVKIRKRRSAEGGLGRDLASIARDYEEKVESLGKDAQSFM